MSTDRPTGILDGRPIVVRDGLAARQWEAYLAADRLSAGVEAWPSPPLIGYRAWLSQLLHDRQGARAAVLSPLQSVTLWRRIVHDSADGAELISDRGAAEWAAAAWALAAEWRVDLASLAQTASLSHDVRAFLGWSDTYRTILADRGWTDPAQIAGALTSTGPARARDTIVADVEDLSPARAGLWAWLQAEGCDLEFRPLPDTAGRASCAGLPDVASELRAAAAWAHAQLGRGATRVALVVPGLGERAEEVARVLADGPWSHHPVPVWQSVAALEADATIGAALTGVELMSPQATFTTLSRWLRSPLFGAPDPQTRGARAKLELELRAQTRSQLPLATAYRSAGLAPWLRQHAPDVGAALAAAFGELEDSSTASPGRWAQRWQRGLARLDWAAGGVQASDTALLSWQSALDDFSRLTPILGNVDAQGALEEFERVLRHRPGTGALPAAGLHVFAHPDNLGPGYDAVWMLGMTDAQWPEPMRPNPLLPRALQRELDMPWSTPEDARRRSARSFARLLRCAPDVVLSWPQRMFDYETDPSPALRRVPELPVSRVDELLENARSRRAATRRARETRADPAPALATSTLRGGTGLLRMQARCPLRAFVQYRLAARPVPAPARGLSSRLRGIATHRALELWLAELPPQAQLVASASKIDAAVARALDEAFGGAQSRLRALFELERARLSNLLTSLIECDARRRPFTVAAVEQARDVRFANRTIRTRIDRLDRLADGRLAVVDYKTGRRASPSEWLSPRLRDAQVPLYVVTADAPVGAAVIAKLDAGTASYSGFWQNDDFPGRARRLPEQRDWDEQIAVWRAQLAELVDEFARGDTRLFVDDLDEARGAFAPLSRVAEQLRLHHGSLPSW